MPLANVPSYSDAPAQDYASITPSDATVLSPPCRRVYCGGAGNLALVSPRGGAATFAVAAGQMLDVNASKILATGTTATLLVAVY